MSYFQSKHPILCVPMNQVSDINLACAIYNAGAFPSFSCYNYYKQGKLHLETFFNECKEFSNRTGSTDILLSLSWEDLLIPEVQSFLIRQQYCYLELFHRPHDNTWPKIKTLVQDLEKQNFKIMFKILKIVKPIDQYSSVILKGSEGAGRTLDNSGTLEDNFNKIRKYYPNKIIIPSGGIGSSEQIKYYIDRGASAIGIGTLFAASEESCVNFHTKTKMIESHRDELSKFGPLNSHGIVFKLDNNDNDNMTSSLARAVKHGSDGAIFAGSAITNINRIMSVKDIIETLTY